MARDAIWRSFIPSSLRLGKRPPWTFFGGRPCFNRGVVLRNVPSHHMAVRRNRAHSACRLAATTMTPSTAVTAATWADVAFADQWRNRSRWGFRLVWAALTVCPLFESILVRFAQAGL